jgi:hypothetical protein
MADIFVSYAREDEPRVRALVSAFESRGWSVFWDRQIPAGSTWRSHIGAALDAARCIVVFWSQHSVKSDWVSEEADEGKRRGILVPVLVDGVLPPRGFREVQSADLGNWQLGEASEEFDRLCADLSNMLSRMATPAESPTPVHAREAPATPVLTVAPSPQRVLGVPRLVGWRCRCRGSCGCGRRVCRWIARGSARVPARDRRTGTSDACARRTGTSDTRDGPVAGDRGQLPA